MQGGSEVFTRLETGRESLSLCGFEGQSLWGLPEKGLSEREGSGHGPVAHPVLAFPGLGWLVENPADALRVSKPEGKGSVGKSRVGILPQYSKKNLSYLA